MKCLLCEKEYNGEADLKICDDCLKNADCCPREKLDDDGLP